MMLGAVACIRTGEADDVGAVQRDAPALVVLGCAPDLECDDLFPHNAFTCCNRAARRRQLNVTA